MHKLHEQFTTKEIIHKSLGGSDVASEEYLKLRMGLSSSPCDCIAHNIFGINLVEQVFYLLKNLLKSGRQLIGFDLNEVGSGDTGWDANVGARVLWRLCNMLMVSNQ